MKERALARQLRRFLPDGFDSQSMKELIDRSRSTMSTASAYLTVAGLSVDVIYKDIKNLHISVYPPVGRCASRGPAAYR